MLDTIFVPTVLVVLNQTLFDFLFYLSINMNRHNHTVYNDCDCRPYLILQPLGGDKLKITGYPYAVILKITFVGFITLE